MIIWCRKCNGILVEIPDEKRLDSFRGENVTKCADCGAYNLWEIEITVKHIKG